MADIVWSDVTDLAAELATGVPPAGVPVGAQTKILAYVNRFVAPQIFGGEDSPKFVLARAYLAAHYGLMVKQMSAAKGPVLSSSEGGVSLSYANLISASSDPLLGSTTYGRGFLSLVRSAPGGVGFST